MSARMSSFVCDRCGNLWEAYRSKRCPACNHVALWQFEDREKAVVHSLRIRNPRESVKPL